MPIFKRPFFHEFSVILVKYRARTMFSKCVFFFLFTKLHSDVFQLDACFMLQSFQHFKIILFQTSYDLYNLCRSVFIKLGVRNLSFLPK